MAESNPLIAALPYVRSAGKTYGDIAALVDFRVDAKSLLVRAIKDDSKPAMNHEDLNLEFGFLDWLNPTSMNESHFQSELLFAQWFWHQSAVEQASTVVDKRKSLFASLVLNAISDHYLHDFFAPGHISTARIGSVNSLALGYHDAGNILEANFEINQTFWNNELEDILKFIIKTYSEKFDEDACNLNNESYILCLSTNSLSYLLNNHESIKLFGDNFLEESENAVQLIFMILTEVRSILDIMETYRTFNEAKIDPDNTKQTNNFFSYDWQSPTRKLGADDKLLFVAPTAKMEFGRYRMDPQLPLQLSELIMLNAAYESFVDKSDEWRFSVTAETAFLGFTGSPYFFGWIDEETEKLEGQGFPFAGYPALGYTYIQASNYRGHGPNFRLVYSFPRLNVEAGPYVRYINYSRPGESEWGLGYQRVDEIGFG